MTVFVWVGAEKVAEMGQMNNLVNLINFDLTVSVWCVFNRAELTL